MRVTTMTGRVFGDSPVAIAQRKRGVTARLLRCGECGAELSRWAFDLHCVPAELLGDAKAQPDSFGRGCVPRLAFGQLGIERFAADRDRWTATLRSVSAAYEAAIDDLAEGRLTFWQRANMSRLAHRPR